MAKCDVCGKNTLVPTKFGVINVCKTCFLKANGLFWKHDYDRYYDAEKHRCKALEAAHKQNFPQHVVSAINEFFMNQMNSMQVCECCGQPVQTRLALGKANICKDCFGKINVSAWKQIDYEDNEEVEKNRRKLLKIAAKHEFPQIVIDDIHKHFNSKIQKGLLYVIDGGNGQKLKVFEDHCVLITNGDVFNVDITSIAYAKALKSGQPKECLISHSAAKSLARSVLTGGIVKTGISMATSAVIDKAVDKYAPDKETFKVVKGSFKIDYHAYNYAEYQKVNGGEIGFIRFINTKSGGRQSDDILFFFRADTDKLNKAYQAICKGIDKAFEAAQIAEAQAAAAVPQPTPQSTPQPVAVSAFSVADEILKFKQLLDMGALTQEEFEAKKKELLGL